MDIKNAVKQWLTDKENRRYTKQLQEKHVSYNRWIREREEACNPHEAGERTCDYVIFLASEGRFRHEQVEDIVCYFAKHSGVEILYGDEDVAENGTGEPERKMPWFKPDWSPDVLKDYFYFGSAVAVKSAVLKEMEAKGMPFQSFAERKYFPECGEVPVYRVTDENAYRKWMMDCAEHVGGFERGNRAIGHMPEIWFSCASEKQQKKFLSSSWGSGVAVGEAADRLGMTSVQGQCKPATVSVIIPSKDNPELLEKCIRACLKVTNMSEKSRIASLEIIVVDNGSTPENRMKIENFVAEFHRGEQRGPGNSHVQISYLYRPMEFNFSVMCNLGAAEAKGEYFLFLNDDVELCQKGTPEEMVTLAAQVYTGAVGLKLLYPGTDKIQHAGITNLPMGPVHKLQFLQDSENYYYNSNRGNRNVMAVTAACLMVTRDKFREAGGFPEELRVAFNDVDFCLKLFELGYHNVCINDRYAYHHESLSRGGDESEEKLKRLLSELDKLHGRHPELIGVDYYYSRHLNREGLDTRIRPGFITAGNKTQQVTAPMKKMNPAGYRQDACLMVRVEDFRGNRAVGYGVVLGDNNACYEKKLLLQCVTPEAESAEIYEVPLAGQYRPDLEENMPDQINVALSGYDVQLQGTGSYRIGMAARNRVTGLKLINWTNRFVERTEKDYAAE